MIIWYYYFIHIFTIYHRIVNDNYKDSDTYKSKYSNYYKIINFRFQIWHSDTYKSKYSNYYKIINFRFQIWLVRQLELVVINCS